MDYRLLIVSFPFLLSLVFTLCILIYNEHKDFFGQYSKETVNIKSLKYENTYLNKLIISNGYEDVNIKEILSNIVTLSTIIFLLLIVITINL